MESAIKFGETLACKVIPSPSVEDIFDLDWASDSSSFVTGSLDHRVCVYFDSSCKVDEKEKENKGESNAGSRSVSPVPSQAAAASVSASSTKDAPLNILTESKNKVSKYRFNFDLLGAFRLLCSII